MEQISREFIDLVTANQGILRKVCSVYAGNEHDREDLFQEILLHAWKSYPGFEGKAKFSTWLYKVALNTALMRRRRARLVPPVSLTGREVEAGERSEKAGTPELEALHSAIAGLDEPEKLLVLLYLDELSYREIAEVTGLTENHIGVKLNRIKAKLKQKVKSDGT